jgi:hypothetical protein
MQTVCLWIRLIGLVGKDKHVLSAMQRDFLDLISSAVGAQCILFLVKKLCIEVEMHKCLLQYDSGTLHVKSVHTPQNRAPWAQNINNRAIPAQQQWNFISATIYEPHPKRNRQKKLLGQGRRERGSCVIFAPEEQKQHIVGRFASLLGKTAHVKRTHVRNSRLTAC